MIKYALRSSLLMWVAFPLILGNVASATSNAATATTSNAATTTASNAATTTTRNAAKTATSNIDTADAATTKTNKAASTMISNAGAATTSSASATVRVGTDGKSDTASQRTTLVAPTAEASTLFYAFDIDPDFSGAADVSGRLPQRALGDGDRIVRAGPHFMRVGTGSDTEPNGERLKAYGINLSFAANFPTAEMAPVVARRLRALGFNAVRLHHLDTKPGRAATPDSILTDGPFPSFNAQAADRLKTFIAALAHEGIYVNLNLRVGYPFRSGMDNVPALPPSGETAPLHIFHPRMRALQAQYARALITRLGLAHNPALAMVEINNESSLLYSYERNRLSAALTRPWRDALGLRWREWLRKREPQASDAYADLQFSAVMAVRGETFAAFLRDLDREYLNELRTVVQEAAGWPVPVTGTQMGYGGKEYVRSHADMDYLDEHFYVDHYDFPNEAWSRTDWVLRNNDLTRADMQKVRVSFDRRDPARPWTMSEYNMAFPNQQGAAILPVVAAMALAGDWDALYFFDYADGKVWNTAADGFTLSGDPAKLALTGQSAALFRAGKPAWLPLDWAFENGKSNDLFALDTPVAAGLMGRQDKGKTYHAGPMTLTLDPSARGYASTMISALDEQTLSKSRHMLITHVAGTRGSEPASDPLRPKALVRSGQYTRLAPDEKDAPAPSGPRDATGPMWLEYAPASLTLRTTADQNWKVYPLDTRGARLAALKPAGVKWQEGVLEIRLDTAHGQASPWYEVVADSQVKK